MTCTLISIQKEKASRAESATPSAAAWYGKATVSNDSDLKIKYPSKAIEQKPDFTSAYLERGRAYNQIAQYDSAITDLNIFIQINPDGATLSKSGKNALNFNQTIPRSINTFPLPGKKPAAADKNTIFKIPSVISGSNPCSFNK